MTELPFCVKPVPSSFVMGSVVGAGASEDAGVCADEPAFLLPPLTEDAPPLLPPNELPELLPVPELPSVLLPVLPSVPVLLPSVRKLRL